MAKGVGISGTPGSFTLNLPPSGLPIMALFPLPISIPNPLPVSFTPPPPVPPTPLVGQFWNGQTGPSGAFVKLFNGPAGAFPIQQGQLNNISSDTLRVSTLESGSNAEDVEPGRQFNFGAVDISQYTVCGATLASNPFKLYTEK